MPANTQPSRTSVRAKPLAAPRAALPVGRATTAGYVGSPTRYWFMVVSVNRSGGRLFEMNSYHLTEHLDHIDGRLARDAVDEKALRAAHRLKAAGLQAAIDDAPCLRCSVLQVLAFQQDGE